jgi:preprotein translocase subunit SecB
MANPTNGAQGNGNPGDGGDQAAQPGGGAAPQLNVLAQYIKDFSFENPNAPRSLQPSQQQPSINLQINVNANALAGSDIEVELKIEGKADAAGSVLFAFDLVYAGVFRIQNVPQNDVHPIVMIECPRLLFPFAREIVASAVRNGGFPPLMIDPIDFVSLYRQKIAEAQGQTSATPS